MWALQGLHCPFMLRLSVTRWSCRATTVGPTLGWENRLRGYNNDVNHSAHLACWHGEFQFVVARNLGRLGTCECFLALSKRHLLLAGVPWTTFPHDVPLCVRGHEYTSLENNSCAGCLEWWVCCWSLAHATVSKHGPALVHVPDLNSSTQPDAVHETRSRSEKQLCCTWCVQCFSSTHHNCIFTTCLLVIQLLVLHSAQDTHKSAAVYAKIWDRLHTWSAHLQKTTVPRLHKHTWHLSKVESVPEYCGINIGGTTDSQTTVPRFVLHTSTK